VTILPNKQTELSDLVLKLWYLCRIDYMLQQAITIKKSETECAFMFHFHTNQDNTRTIKLKLLSHSTGVMSPHFDEFGDMDAFTWEFLSVVNKKNVKNIWIFDKTNVYKYSDLSETMSFVSAEAHGFTRIPIVYMSQDNTEWFDVEKIIDRYETSISRLVESNDYSGHPILALYGKIKSMPERDNSGKTLNFPIETTDDGKPVQGDAKFITHDNAPESVKLELDTFDNLIYSLSQTPNISFNNLKGMGAISGIAIKFMFLDAILKAKSNEGENRTIIERCLNILTDGVITTLKTALKNQAIDLSWSIIFNSILPNDISTLITDLSAGVEAKIISQETAVKELSMTEDDEKELKTINSVPDAVVQ
jgi:SPP1 family phage portal protein